LKYQTHQCDDSDDLQVLREKLSGKQVFVIGPGKKMESEKEKIASYLAGHQPVIMSINYIPKGYQVAYLFTTNSKRYNQMYSQLSRHTEIQVIATSNVTRTRDRFDFELNYSNLIDPSTQVPDNSLIMLLRTFQKIGVRDVYLAGFDGYHQQMMNYLYTNMEYSMAEEKASYLNNYTRKFIAENKKDLDIHFVTSSYYEQ
jgi:4-hydroxy 2-oxovalerate aldolase